jgi:hypothetical protein
MAKLVLRKDQIERIVNYYELDIKQHPNYFGVQGVLMDLVREVIALTTDINQKNRYRKIFDKTLLMQDVKVDPVAKNVKGKLRSIRKDLFPELFDTIKDEARDLDAGEDDGVVETSHFCIDYSKKNIRVALEFNYQGAKINDLINYLAAVGIREQICTTIVYNPIIKGNLEEEVKKLNRCSEFVVKVHRNRVDEVKKLDGKLMQAMKASVKDFGNQYATVKFSFDYKNMAKTDAISKLVRKIGKIIFKQPELGNVFESMIVTAEDPTKGNKLETFDLLLDKVRSKVLVLKKPKGRTVVSDEMYSKIIAEMKRLKI